MKRRALLVSLSANISLTTLKVVAAVLTGSVSLLSESVHSATDVAVSFVTFFSVKAASAPPDDEHPYGHGKIESLAGFGEAIFLLLMVSYVFNESVERLIHGSKVQHLSMGIWIMAISAVTSLCVGPYLRKVAETTESMALKSNAKHQMIDFVTSTGVLIALVITKTTGWEKADAWFAIGLGFWIAYSAFQIGRESAQQLIDKRVSDDEITAIHRVISETPDLISYHRLRTRHSGHVHYIDVHAVVPNDWSVVRAHALADDLEERIELALSPAHAVVHIDPYDPTKVDMETPILAASRAR